MLHKLNQQVKCLDKNVEMTTVVASSNLKIVELNRKIAALQSHNEELQQHINAHETWCPTALSVIKNAQDDLM